ncbi:MAG: SRPBCC domain-containing protein [Planctomycetaceae bacterium]|nr:SRPBCC domain-containing protein [Planctomycetaceae bacterium]
MPSVTSFVKRGLILMVIVCGAANHAAAEVTDAADTGFTIRHHQQVAVEPAEAYRHFVRVGSWWSSAHTYSGDATNMTIDDKPGGAFLEKLPGGGFVEHMKVIFANPGKKIRLSGGLGPLQEYPVNGVMTVTFTKNDRGTRIDMTYRVGGSVSGGLMSWSSPVDQMLAEQFASLEELITTPAAR